MKMKLVLMLVSLFWHIEAKESGCRIEWLNQQEICFQFNFDQKADYFTALTNCERGGGASLAGDSLDEHQVIRKLTFAKMKNRKNVKIWIKSQLNQTCAMERKVHNISSDECPILDLNFEYPRRHSRLYLENCSQEYHFVCRKPIGNGHSFSKNLFCSNCENIRRKRRIASYPNSFNIPHYNDPFMGPFQSPFEVGSPSIEDSLHRFNSIHFGDRYMPIIHKQYHIPDIPPSKWITNFNSQKFTPRRGIYQIPHFMTNPKEPKTIKNSVLVDNITTELHETSTHPQFQTTQTPKNSVFNTTLNILLTDERNISCYEGEFEVDGRCIFMFSAKQMTWAEAQKYCAKHALGGQLLNPRHEGILNSLDFNASLKNDVIIWVGDRTVIKPKVTTTIHPLLRALLKSSEKHNSQLNSLLSTVSLSDADYDVNYCGISHYKQKSVKLEQKNVKFAPCDELHSFFCEYIWKDNATVRKIAPKIMGGSCPPDWMERKGGCLKVFKENMTWSDAEKSCLKQNSILLNFDPNKVRRINSTRVIIFSINSKYRRNSSEKMLFWVQNNIKHEGEKKSVDANMSKCIVIETFENTEDLFGQNPKEVPCSNLHFYICNKKLNGSLKSLLVSNNIEEKSSFAPPSDVVTSNVVTSDVVTSDAIAIDVVTSDVVTSIIQFPSTSTHVQKEEGPCPNLSMSGWVKFGTFCYKFYSFAHLTPRTWYQSRDFCSRENAYLASIHSKEENDWVFSKVKDFQDNFLWIGGRYEGMEDFVWQDGSPFDFIYWNQGEPNNLNDEEECIALYSRYSGGRWNDAHCFQKAGHICQKPVPITMTTKTTTNMTTAMLTTLMPLTNASTKITISNTSFVHSPLSTSQQTPKITKRTPNTKDLFTRLSYTTATPKIDDKRSKNISDLSEMNPKYNYKESSPAAGGGCPRDWYKLGERCVKYYTSEIPVNYFEATMQCKNYSQKTTLVSIRSDREASFLKSLMSNFFTAWIGLKWTKSNRGIDISSAQWQDGTSWTYYPRNKYYKIDKLARISDISSKSDVCVILKLDDRFQSSEIIGCGDQINAFICQIPSDPQYDSPDVPYTSKCESPHNEFFSFHHSCYKLVEKTLNWQNAEQACTYMGAKLVTIRNKHEQKFLSIQYEKHIKSNSFWIGLSSHPNEKFYVWWSSGWPLLYKHWKYTYNPDFGFSTEHKCVLMYAGFRGLWLTNKCSDENPFICEISNKTFSAIKQTNSPDQKSCPKQDGWLDFGTDFCYTFDRFRKHKWAEANHRCFQLGGYLVTIHTLRELERLKKISRSLDTSLWIGASRLHNGVFGWADYTSMNFSFWGPDEPSQSSFENCVQMSHLYGFWNVKTCLMENYYVCQTLKTNLLNGSEAENTSETALQTTTEIIKDLKLSAAPGSIKETRSLTCIIVVVVLILFGTVGLGVVFYFKRKRAMCCTRPLSYDFDNVVYNAEIRNPEDMIRGCEEQECILDSNECSENEQNDAEMLAKIASQVKV